jgi:hypothetical protein
MNKIRFGCFLSCVIIALSANVARAQTSIQRISLYLLADYQKDFYYTNLTSPSEPLTNVNSHIRSILITTGNVVKALALDLDGTNLENTNIVGTNTWRFSELVREVNLTNGAEGIFLRKGSAQTNVSSFFSISFSNNFQGGLPVAFPFAANDFTNTILSGSNSTTNIVTNNFVLQNPLARGWVYQTNATNFRTNFIQTSGLYYVSLNTTNLKFNMLCEGPGSITNVSGTKEGTSYSWPVSSISVGCAGAYYVNITTNIFETGTNPPMWVSGPLRGSFVELPPYYSATNGPE